MPDRSPKSRLASLAWLGLLLAAGALYVERSRLPAGHTASVDEREKETAVLVAAFRQQVEEHLDPTEKARRTVLCLAIDPGGAPQSPSRELMARLAGEPSVRRAAECDARPEGAVEATTGRPAILVTAGPIEWVADDEAWVEVSYHRSARQAARRRYRVVREREGWVSLGPILLDGPP